jgi:hypothetical protein
MSDAGDAYLIKGVKGLRIVPPATPLAETIIK